MEVQCSTSSLSGAMLAARNLQMKKKKQKRLNCGAIPFEGATLTEFV